jgi:hypothetical protein
MVRTRESRRFSLSGTDPPTGQRDSQQYLKRNSECDVLSGMAEEKNPKKDILLWIIAVVLVAVAIFWYKK